MYLVLMTTYYSLPHLKPWYTTGERVQYWGHPPKNLKTPLPFYRSRNMALPKNYKKLPVTLKNMKIHHLTHPKIKKFSMAFSKNLKNSFNLFN